MTTSKISLRVPDELWEKFKQNVDQTKSIHGHVITLLEKFVKEKENDSSR